MQNQPKSPSLPLSLKQKRARNFTIRIICCILLLLLFIFIIIMWGDKLFPTTLKSHMGYNGLKIMFYILLLSVPFIVTGTPFKLIDTSWSGTVIDVTVEENLKANGAGRPRLHKSHDLILTIQTDNGKEIEHTLFSFASPSLGKVHYHENKISIGDRIHKYYGFKYPYIIPKNHHQIKVCISCGAANNVDKKRCWHCKSELLFDPKNLYK